MTMLSVVHLIDDTTAGGVMRVLDHIATSSEMARTATHRVQTIRRGTLSLTRIDADVVVSHLSVSWRSLPGLIALRAVNAGTPMIHVEHSYTEAFAEQNVRRRARFFALLRTAYALFDRVAAVSQAQARWLGESGLVRTEQLSTITSHVDLSAFAALDAPATRPRVIGAIGRLEPQKGFDTLIRAFRADPGLTLELRIVGEGAERAALEALAEGDPRITFTGATSDPVAAMATFDAVAMPSRWEAFGLVALEARAAKRPILVHEIDGLRDHIAEGAVAVAPDAPAAWSVALRRLQDAGAPSADVLHMGHDVARVAGARFVDAWNTVLQRTLNSSASAAKSRAFTKTHEA